ncbi:MAG: hypothetical protein EZS28_008857 [Streblomastix strix]|uniref:Uncharacterized protein n=1 Tax=Streblomastix strix TaxID=222440 RepID=A0A5J4WKU2_9EUKA|nr:MAG: hypothetical protein EZS28_008857 [Streblomastix strix]
MNSDVGWVTERKEGIGKGLQMAETSTTGAGTDRVKKKRSGIDIVSQDDIPPPFFEREPIKNYALKEESSQSNNFNGLLLSDVDADGNEGNIIGTEIGNNFILPPLSYQ